MDNLNDKLSLKLIEIYKSCGALWDPNDANYFNKNEKAEGWKEMTRISGLSEDVCKRKMMSLLASWRREMSKFRKSQRIATDPSEIYRSRWFAYNAFQFLEDRYPSRKQIKTELIEMSNGAEEENSKQEHQVDEQADAFIAPSVRKRKKTRQDESTRIIADTLAVMKTAAGNLTKSDNNCVVESFGNFLVMKMMSYSSDTRIGVEHAIFDVLKKADRGFFEESAKNQTPHLHTQKTNQKCVSLVSGAHTSRSASLTPTTSAHSPQFLTRDTPSSASGYEDSDDSNDYL